jgi:hypothetical protein
MRSAKKELNFGKIYGFDSLSLLSFLVYFFSKNFCIYMTKLKAVVLYGMDNFRLLQLFFFL